eukprot:1136945-Pelagomonas_calceolata.AAC.1
MAEGAHVVMASRDQKTCQAAAEKLREQPWVSQFRNQHVKFICHLLPSAIWCAIMAAADLLNWSVDKFFFSTPPPVQISFLCPIYFALKIVTVMQTVPPKRFSAVDLTTVVGVHKGE